MSVPPATLEPNGNLTRGRAPGRPMPGGRARWAAVALAALAAGAVTGQPLSAKEETASKSAPLALALAKQLDQAKLQYIAAPDPSEAGRYVAAMYLSGVQIYVISAKYAVPELLREKMFSAKYQDIYIDLTSASDRASRIGIEDLKANGLARTKQREPPFDVYEARGKRVTFDFDWRKQKLTEEDYFKTLETADELYTRVLTLLLAEAQKPK